MTVELRPDETEADIGVPALPGAPAGAVSPGRSSWRRSTPRETPGSRRSAPRIDLANAPMRRVDEGLGYRLRLAWIHLGGPLL